MFSLFRVSSRVSTRSNSNLASIFSVHVFSQVPNGLLNEESSICDFNFQNEPFSGGPHVGTIVGGGGTKILISHSNF